MPAASRLLLVDDDEYIRVLVGENLQQLGYQVDAAQGEWEDEINNRL